MSELVPVRPQPIALRRRYNPERDSPLAGGSLVWEGPLTDRQAADIAVRVEFYSRPWWRRLRGAR